MKRKVGLMGAGLLLALGSVAAAQEVGQEIPDFDAKEFFTGQKFSLKALRGQVVLIDFWATW